MWRFRGTPTYLARQAKRLGVREEFVHFSRRNPQIYRIAVLLSELCEEWHRARKENGLPVFEPGTSDRARDMLARSAMEVARLHVLAAAANEMLEEACAACGVASSGPRFEVTLKPNTHILPFGDGTVGIADDELEPALTEGG